DKPPSGGFDALTDFSFIFVHRDRFTSYRLEHEWLHIYLGLSAKRLFGDYHHNDPLFLSCAK
ncbi:MAG: hypothetical protein WAP51_00270, partial [Candidatus Sungiibacteriota bacterium]